MSETKIYDCDNEPCDARAEGGTGLPGGWVQAFGGRPYRSMHWCSWSCMSAWALSQVQNVNTQMVVK